MGGYSSGRPGWRAKCEHCLSIDVRRWVRSGYLSDTGYFHWSWTINGDQHCSARFWVHEHSIEPDYSKDGKPYRYTVWLVQTPCFLGGKRTWFQCPNMNCRRRAAKLYLGSRYFACRRCYNLAYQSQCYSSYDRALTQAGKIRTRLGGPEGIAWPFPDKPKRMRWRTYERLRGRCERYEDLANSRLFLLLARRLPEYG